MKKEKAPVPEKVDQAAINREVYQALNTILKAFNMDWCKLPNLEKASKKEA